MDSLFLTVLNMSLTGAFVIAAICLARIPLKKAPKIISYCLWAVVGFRLVFPYSIESVFSFIPFYSTPIPHDIAMQAVPRIESGILFVNNAVSSILPAAMPYNSANPLQIWTAIGAYIWLFGIAVMVTYGVVSYIILKRKMRSAVCAEGNIYEAENIISPFVLGIFKPKIYLPFGLGEKEHGYILLHEQIHIKRYDHIIKFGAYFILCLHWFNPLAWIAFFLMSVDMEMSCDECVLKEMGGETKKDYSLSLLSLATERRLVGGSPLAFGEGGVKQRIKNVLIFRNPSRLIIVVSAALVLVLSAGFAVNRVADEPVLSSAYQPHEWVNYLYDEQMPWSEQYDISLDEFPGTVFSWTPYHVTVTDLNGTRELISGGPVWNVFFADLNSDGFPELCATVSIGSGIVDTRVIVYDLVNDRTYSLDDRAQYDYILSLENGQLVVTQLEYMLGAVRANGSMAIINGELVIYGIDRTLSMGESVP